MLHVLLFDQVQNRSDVRHGVPYSVGCHESVDGARARGCR
jgi:hypothetical protein